MAISNKRDKERPKGHLAMKTPLIVSQQEWEAARQQLLVKEKALTRSRDCLLYTSPSPRDGLLSRMPSSA